MTLRPLQRRMLLALALALTIGAALWDTGADSLPPSSAQGVRVAAKPRGTTVEAPLPELDLERLEASAAAGKKMGDAFEVRSWAPPPAPPPPPPAPRAPPLPYTFIGKMMEAGETVVFLAKQGRNYAVRKGEALDGVYRVDDIRGGTMTLTYLPLDQQQTLAVGGVN